MGVRHPAAAGRGLGLGTSLELGTWDLELLLVALTTSSAQS